MGQVFDFSPFEFKMSRSFRAFGQRSLALNILTYFLTETWLVDQNFGICYIVCLEKICKFKAKTKSSYHVKVSGLRGWITTLWSSSSVLR